MRARSPSGLSRFTPHSLEGRLLLGSGVAVALALASMLGMMHVVLTRFVTGQIDQRLDNKIVSLASQLRLAPEGRITIDGDADGPPFAAGPSFWLVEGPRNALRSSSLAGRAIPLPSAAALDRALSLPSPPGPAADLEVRPGTLVLTGPDHAAFHERVAQSRIDGSPVLILVAAPVSAIADPVGEAMIRVGGATLALGAVFVALALAQVKLGLRPLERLRRHVAEVADGRRERLPTTQPREIAPLVSEMNRLLEGYANNLDKARRHVANLAHGLKTPLATLSLGFERLNGPGKEEMRALLAQLDHRVRHHLSRARAGALAGPERVHTPLAPRLADLGGAMARLHADAPVQLTLRCPADVALACDPNDVDEIFGNLLDNAFRFAHSQVTCSAHRAGPSVEVQVADDGPGLTETEVVLAVQPGRRLDEESPGFGFGLTIARELSELYGGSLVFERGNPGLLVRVTLPASRASA